jgi:hypothetical protein
VYVRLQSVADLEDAMKIIPTLAKKVYRHLSNSSTKPALRHYGSDIDNRAGVLVCFSSTESKRVFTGLHSIQRATSGFSSLASLMMSYGKVNTELVFLRHQSTFNIAKRGRYFNSIRRATQSESRTYLTRKVPDLVDKVDESCPMRWNVNEQIC